MAKETNQSTETKGGKKKQNWFQKAWNGIKRWFREMKSELKKVVWPSRKQVTKNTIVAVTVMVVSGIVLWAFDQVAMLVVQTLISIGG